MLKFIGAVSRASAMIGGAVLCGLILMVCLSVAGRGVNEALHHDLIMRFMPDLAQMLLSIGVGPIIGDNEILEAGMAFAIFSFLPAAQLYGAHASVDILANHLPRRLNQLLIALFEVIFAAVLLLITAQLFQGMISKRASNQTSFYLQYPIWWGYAASLSGAIAASLVSVTVAAARCAELFTGLSLLPQAQGDKH